MVEQTAVHRRGNADGDREVSYLRATSHHIDKDPKSHMSRHVACARSYRRVELFGLVVALAAVYQKVDVVRVGSDGVRQVSFRQLVPANDP